MAALGSVLPTAPISGPDARTWIAQVEAAARVATQDFPVDDVLFSFAGARIRISLAGPALAAWLRPALGHALRPVDAAQPPSPGDIRLIIWDEASTGVAPPAPFWDEGGWASRGDLPALAEEGIVGAYHEHAGYLSVVDWPRRRAWVWVRDAAALPRYERAAPLRGPLSWLLSADGGQLAHAGCVATPDGAALLVGPGGVGKSTTSMACLGGGLDYLGDDYVLLRQDPASRPTAHMLYATAKLTERSLDLLPHLRPLADGPGTGDEKAVLQVAGAARAAPIVALILPRLGDGQASVWEPASSSRALTALAPTTLFQLPGAGRESLSRLAALVRSAPAFTLHLGRDMAGIAPAVSAIIAAASGAGAP